MSSLTSCRLTHRSNALSVVRQQDAVIARQEAALASRAEYLYRNVCTHSHVKCFLHESSRATVLRRFLHRSCAGSALMLYTCFLSWMAYVVRTCRCCSLTLLACCCRDSCCRLYTAHPRMKGYPIVSCVTRTLPDRWWTSRQRTVAPVLWSPKCGPCRGSCGRPVLALGQARLRHHWTAASTMPVQSRASFLVSLVRTLDLAPGLRTNPCLGPPSMSHR